MIRSCSAIAVACVCLVASTAFSTEIHFTNPSNNQTFYALAGHTTIGIGIYFNYTITDPYYIFDHVTGQIDGGPWNPAYSTQTLGLGPHTISITLFEAYILGGVYQGPTTQITVYVYPSFNVTVKNGFAGGELYIGGTLYPNVTADGITVYNVHQNATLGFTAVDNQTPADGLLRTFKYWNGTDPNFQQNSSLSATATITGAYAYQANFHKQPSQPQNLAIVQNSYRVNLSWDNTSETGFQYWEVWRMVTEVHGRIVVQDWTMIATRTTNSFEDPDFVPNPSDPKTVTYKLRAKGDGDLYSAYSSEVSLQAGQIFYKQAGKKPATLPTELSLSQNYPNPFNPTTSITYALPEASNVRIAVYNETGIEVDVLVNGNVSAGFHEVSFNATRHPSGIYFCKMNAGKYSDVKRMLLLK